MWASFGAEWLKLRKRRAVQVLVLLIVGVALLFGYALPYWFYRGAQGGTTIWGGIGEQLLLGLLPGKLIQQTLNASVLADLLILILGVLVGGSEYGWGTLKTVLTRRPGRIAVYGGKVLALGVAVTIIVLTLFGGAIAASALVTVTEGDVARQASAADLTVKLGPLFEDFGVGSAEREAATLADELPRALQWPSPLEIGKAIGAVWLLLATFAAFGLFLGTLARGTALAMSVGLVWLLVVEGQIQNRASRNTFRWLLSENSTSLTVSFFPEDYRMGHFSATQAVVVLAGYTLLFIALGVLLLRTRDVT